MIPQIEDRASSFPGPFPYPAPLGTRMKIEQKPSHPPYTVCSLSSVVCQTRDSFATTGRWSGVHKLAFWVRFSCWSPSRFSPFVALIVEYLARSNRTLFSFWPMTRMSFLEERYSTESNHSNIWRVWFPSLSVLWFYWPLISLIILCAEVTVFLFFWSPQ